jgi:hypothetical protein
VEKINGFQCIRKLMIVMMELVILILLKVQANHLLPSFCPIRLHHFFELDKVQTQLPIIYPHSFGLDEVQGMMHTCVVDLIKVCQETSQQIYGYGFCIFHGFEECVHPHGQSIIQESYNFLLHCLAHAEWSELQSCYLSLAKKLAKDSNVLYAESLEQRFDKDFLIIFSISSHLLVVKPITYTTKMETMLQLVSLNPYQSSFISVKKTSTFICFYNIKRMSIIDYLFSLITRFCSASSNY